MGHRAIATADGAIRLVHCGGYGDLASTQTEVFDLTGIYSPPHERTNGYGTLDQAGPPLEKEMTAVNLSPTSPIAMSNKGQQIMLVWAYSGSNGVQYRVGGYSVHTP